MSLRVLLSLLAFRCLTFPAGAQTIAKFEPERPDALLSLAPNQGAALAASPATLSLGTRTSVEFKSVMRLFQKGLYSEVVDTTTALLEKADADDNHIADPAWLYFRGYAYRRMSWFDQAKRDLQPLGNFAASPVKSSTATWAPASTVVEKLDVILASRPLHQYLVRDGKQVRYRVYYNQDDAFFRTVVEALSTGYSAASKFTKIQATEIPVFVFNRDEYPQFTKFFTAQTGDAPRVWFRVLSRSESIFICQRDGLGKTFTADLDLMTHLMSHETTHILMSRTQGRIKDFPDWFNEGAFARGFSLSDGGLRLRDFLGPRSGAQLLQVGLRS